MASFQGVSGYDKGNASVMGSHLYFHGPFRSSIFRSASWWAWGNRDEFGFALVGHDYKSSYADNVGRCFFLCSSDERCQSATFFWNTKDCKMNRETKASRPADFVKNPSATYIENYFRGNVNYRLKKVVEYHALLCTNSIVFFCLLVAILQ